MPYASPHLVVHAAETPSLSPARPQFVRTFVIGGGVQALQSVICGERISPISRMRAPNSDLKGRVLDDLALRRGGGFSIFVGKECRLRGERHVTLAYDESERCICPPRTTRTHTSHEPPQALALLPIGRRVEVRRVVRDPDLTPAAVEGAEH
eukprot:scaffold35554_cov57-Phaeocystis_antarctica.AAC.1